MVTSTMRSRPRRLVLAVAAATAAIVTAGCTHHDTPPAPAASASTPAPSVTPTPSHPTVADSKTLLRAAADDFAATSAVHFALIGSDLPTKGKVLVAAEGDAARPDRLKATATTRSDGSQLTTDVIAIGDRAWVQVPLIGTWVESNDTRLDARMLWADDTGVSALLREVKPDASSPAAATSGRRVVDGTLPGTAVRGLIPGVDTTGEVPVEVTVDTGVTAARVSSLRLTVDLDGSRSTYLLNLSDYGKTVDIQQP
jgi:LppX_LprAFG lipoprotein